MLRHIPFYASLMKQELFSTDDVAVVATQGHVLVYGAVEAHSMGPEGCKASNKTIGTETGLSTSRTSSILSELSKAGWLHVELDENNQRITIVPLLTLAADGNPPSYTRQPPLAADGNIEYRKEYSKNKNTKKISDDDKLNVEKLYRGWLIEIVIGGAAWKAAGAAADSRSSLLEAARKKVRLTEKRHRKMLLRQQELGMDSCIKAIKNLARASDFYRGNNENKWKATIEWLFNSTEKTEEWANK